MLKNDLSEAVYRKLFRGVNMGNTKNLLKLDANGFVELIDEKPIATFGGFWCTHAGELEAHY